MLDQVSKSKIHWALKLALVLCLFPLVILGAVLIGVARAIFKAE